MSKVVQLPLKPANDPGSSVIVTVYGKEGKLFEIGGGPNVLFPFDPDEYDQAVAALKSALKFMDNEA